MIKPRIINFQSKIDTRGSLTIVERDNLPFLVKRLFYIYNVSDGKERGNHANIKSQFMMIPLKGSCTVIVEDGEEKTEFDLNDSTQGLYIPKMTWKTMKNFSEDCLLMVLSDQEYDKTEYINDYQMFKKAKL